MSFTTFNLDPRLAAGVQACGYGEPTPIQNQAIPPAMEGRDVMGLAQTGTGKTAAFALPIMQRLLNDQRGGLRALILAPTRELAEQIRGSFRELGRKAGLVAISIYGGANMNHQIKDLRRGADIVVACPGRLLDHIQHRTIDLSKLEVLVLDEADMMLDMGFLPDIRRILAHLPVKRQNMMFSATMPTEIRSLSTSILRDPAVIQISSSTPVETVSHALYPITQNLKTALLVELLKKTDTGSVLIFTRTKHRAKRVGAQLVKEGHRASSLQGNLSQNARQAALDGFRSGKFTILVATDIAARGIDVSQVSHVINYDIPDTTAAYTHRIGRTGRALRTGDAFTLVTPEDSQTVRDIERVIGSTIERRTLEGFNYKQAAPSQTVQFAREPRAPRQQRQPQRTAQNQPQRSSRTDQPRHARPHRIANRYKDATPRTESRSGNAYSAGFAGSQHEDRPNQAHKPLGQSRHGNPKPRHSQRPPSEGQSGGRPAQHHRRESQPQRPGFTQHNVKPVRTENHERLVEDLVN